MKGLVLLFQKRETSEQGYPYTNFYNLIEVEVDKEDWSEDPYYILRRSNIQVPIGSWEENNDYDARVTRKVERMKLKGYYLFSDEMETYHIYDAEANKLTSLGDHQENVEHCLMQMLSSEFLLRP